MSVGVRARISRASHTDLASETLRQPTTGYGLWLRYAGHLLVVLLLALVVRNVTVSQPQPLALDLSLPMTQPQQTDVEGAIVSRPETESHFLSQGAVPLTVRLRGQESNPIAEPRRQVRTSVISYTVQPGDSVLGIAQRFGLEGTSVLWANKTLEQNPDWLQIGQQLSILPVDGALHTVSSGDTLQAIANYYKVEVPAITGYEGNQVAANADLKVGQQLIIPGGVKPYVARQAVAYSGQVPADAKKGSGNFAWPMSGYISQQFWEGHRAIDIAASRGTSIVAADSGFVVSSQWSDTGYGRMVIIDHGNGYQTLYAHMDTYFVEVGQSVAKGQAIGKCGSTGNSTGPHLHFEILEGSARRNPTLFLP